MHTKKAAMPNSIARYEPDTLLQFAAHTWQHSFPSALVVSLFTAEASQILARNLKRAIETNWSVAGHPKIKPLQDGAELRWPSGERMRFIALNHIDHLEGCIYPAVALQILPNVQPAADALDEIERLTPNALHCVQFEYVDDAPF